MLACAMTFAGCASVYLVVSAFRRESNAIIEPRKGFHCLFWQPFGAVTAANTGAQHTRAYTHLRTAPNTHNPNKQPKKKNQIINYRLAHSCASTAAPRSTHACWALSTRLCVPNRFPHVQARRTHAEQCALCVRLRLAVRHHMLSLFVWSGLNTRAKWGGGAGQGGKEDRLVLFAGGRAMRQGETRRTREMGWMEHARTIFMRAFAIESLRALILVYIYIFIVCVCCTCAEENIFRALFSNMWGDGDLSEGHTGCHSCRCGSFFSGRIPVRHPLSMSLGCVIEYV